MGIRVPRFKLRTLFVLTAILALVFLVCAKWPVTEVGLSGDTNYWLEQTSNAAIGVWDPTPPTPRPPTFGEWALRAGISSVLVILFMVVIGQLRRGKAGPVRPSP